MSNIVSGKHTMGKSRPFTALKSAVCPSVVPTFRIFTRGFPWFLFAFVVNYLKMVFWRCSYLSVCPFSEQHLCNLDVFIPSVSILIPLNSVSHFGWSKKPSLEVVGFFVLKLHIYKESKRFQAWLVTSTKIVHATPQKCKSNYQIQETYH